VRDLVSEVRRELAQHLLRDTDLSVTEVAHILSYSDSTVFARAFRRFSRGEFGDVERWQSLIVN